MDFLAGHEQGDGFEILWEREEPTGAFEFRVPETAHAGPVLKRRRQRRSMEGPEAGHVIVDPRSGRALGRAEPTLTWDHWRARVGEPVHIQFFDLGGEMTKEHALADAGRVNDWAVGDEYLYVGCSDGFLYAFTFEGELAWRWETPGRGRPRVAPWHVRACGPLVLSTTFSYVYAIDGDGTLEWAWRTPLKLGDGEEEIELAEAFAAFDDSGPYDPYRRAVKTAGRLLDTITAGDRESDIQSISVGKHAWTFVEDGAGQLHQLDRAGRSVRSVEVDSRPVSVQVLADGDGMARGTLSPILTEGIPKQVTAIADGRVRGSSDFQDRTWRGAAVGPGLLTYGDGLLRGFDADGRHRWQASPGRGIGSITAISDVCVVTGDYGALAGVRFTGAGASS